jgi:CBS domain-containing protein
MGKATVREAMTSSPTTVESDANILEAAKRMTSENVGSLPVVQNGELVGMVTDRDLVTNVLAKDLDPSKVTVADVTSDNPIVATPDEPLDAALRRMASEQVRRLPVVDGGKLVGILAQADVAQSAEAESTGQMVEQISEKS